MAKLWNLIKKGSKKVWNATNTDQAKNIWSLVNQGVDKFLDSDLGDRLMRDLDATGYGGIARQVGSELRGFGNDLVNRDDSTSFTDFVSGQLGKRTNLDENAIQQGMSYVNKAAPHVDKWIGNAEDAVRSVAKKKKSKREVKPAQMTKDLPTNKPSASSKKHRGVRRG